MVFERFAFQDISATIIDVKENYSVTVESHLVGSSSNDKINVSILCPITRIGLIESFPFHSIAFSFSTSSSTEHQTR